MASLAIVVHVIAFESEDHGVTFVDLSF